MRHPNHPPVLLLCVCVCVYVGVMNIMLTKEWLLSNNNLSVAVNHTINITCMRLLTYVYILQMQNARGCKPDIWERQTSPTEDRNVESASKMINVEFHWEFFFRSRDVLLHIAYAHSTITRHTDSVIRYIYIHIVLIKVTVQTFTLVHNRVIGYHHPGAQYSLHFAQPDKKLIAQTAQVLFTTAIRCNHVCHRLSAVAYVDEVRETIWYLVICDIYHIIYIYVCVCVCKWPIVHRDERPLTYHNNNNKKCV